MASINNLVSLGFTKERAAEAFFACDKNEEFAANFLFEQAAEDSDAQDKFETWHKTYDFIYLRSFWLKKRTKV